MFGCHLSIGGIGDFQMIATIFENIWNQAMEHTSSQEP
jgi:hypothetical protein